LCERQFALGAERLPNCPCSLADFFFHCDSKAARAAAEANPELRVIGSNSIDLLMLLA
jgi:hypothetical protein